MGIADAQAPLLGAVDEEKAAKRPEGLTAEILLAFLLDHDDVLARVGELGGCDQTGESGAYDDDIRICSHDLVSPTITD
jgi:hypothetical protein